MKMLKAKLVRTIGLTDWDNALPSEATGHNGDLLIWDLWQNGTDSVHNMRVMETDASSQSGKQPEKCLQEAER